MGIPRITLCLLATGVLLLEPHQPVQAASATANLSVSATIVNNCTISTTPVSFSSYDPIGANATVDADNGTGTVTITCTRGTTATIGLGPGSNASGTTRRMLNGTSNYLNYELYQTSARTTVWGNSGTALFSPEPPRPRRLEPSTSTAASSPARTCPPAATPTPSKPP